MNRIKRMGRLGGLVVSAVAAVPSVYLWVQMMINADDPLTLRIRLDMAIWIAVFGAPWMVAARLLWRAWWRRAGAALPAGRVFALTFVGLLGGLATLAVARRRWVGLAGAGPAVTGLTLAGVAGCVGFTTYVAEYPLTPSGHPPVISATLTPVTAVVLAVVLAAGLWLAVAPPRWAGCSWTPTAGSGWAPTWVTPSGGP